jgi:predicted RNA-binding protein YlxR (DUF448 family)
MPKRRPDHQPLRTCAVCRDVHPKQSMTRLVRRADGSVAADPSGKAPGRGTYLCDQSSCHEPQRLSEGIQRALGGHPAPGLLASEASNASA